MLTKTNSLNHLYNSQSGAAYILMASPTALLQEEETDVLRYTTWQTCIC